MSVLVTGGAGFIGAHVTRTLLERGEAVVILDDFNDRYDPSLKEARVRELIGAGGRCQVVRGSITDRELLNALCRQERFDRVLHLAAWSSVPTSLENPYPYARANMEGTVNVFEAVCRAGKPSIVFASSSSVYGGRTDVPFREDDNVMHPISPYAASKVAGEVLAATWHAMYKVPVNVLRFFNIYGPWGRPEGALFKFANAIMNGEPVEMRGRGTARDFTYVDDCVGAIVSAMDHAQGFEVMNIGEADAVPLPRFIAALEHALGRKAQVQEVSLPPGELPVSLADVSKARRLLGYRPATSIEEGVAKFAEWYLSWYFPRFVKNKVAATHTSG